MRRPRTRATLFPYTTLFRSKKLGGIVFHEKLGTVADKVERVAKLARWLVEQGIVKADAGQLGEALDLVGDGDRKSTRLNSSHTVISYAVFCLKKKETKSKRT